ncbi:Uu.00g120170.m01.CDS01 [Anthostomella pinea]|uniref:Uu.00g120170.m01.CDS01 n=1 Tax=Anthostomella pinea TaxID=933095 RepID=A0AAI8VGT0_9PEZI|nr:Uu.00g120170.m01.CDS01 [Anthostomella pinea]
MAFTSKYGSLLILLSLMPTWAGALVTAQNVTDKHTLAISLNIATTELDRLDILYSDTDWMFDFFAQPTYTYSPGAVINANAATFPTTVGNGLTLAWVTLGPCGMQAPHYHPRASNYIVAIDGSVETYMIAENGARMVTNLLGPGKMTLFPRGSLHSMQNKGCGNATLVSALSTEDPGTHTVANGLFNLPRDMVAAAFGGNKNLDIDDLMKAIPPVGTGVTMGSADCLAKCSMQ